MVDKVVTAQEMKKLDDWAINQLKIPSMFLMEKAGLAVATEIGKALQGKKNHFVCFICGVGNNGGDGFVAARFLLNAGIKIKIFVIGDVAKLSDDATANYLGLKKMNCAFDESGTVLPSELQAAEIVVDALFGIGLDREITDPHYTAIEAINQHAKFVIAVDVPSGLDATSGKIHGICVKAAKTVTFHLPKKGLFQGQGPEHAGEVVLADIGIPTDI